MENENTNPQVAESPNGTRPVEAPSPILPRQKTLEIVLFAPIAAGVFWVLLPWLNMKCYLRFLDAWTFDPFTPEAKNFSAVVAGIYLVCCLSLLLPWLFKKFPHFLVSWSIFLSAMALSITFGLWNMSGAHLERNLEGVLLGAGLFGLFIGGPLAVFLRFDDNQSSALAVSVISGIIGMVLMSWLLYEILERFGINLGDVNTLALGGVIGFLVGMFGSSWLLGSATGDRIFKYLVCTTCAGTAARVVYLTLVHVTTR